MITDPWFAFSGLTSTIAHAGGPPLSVYLLPQQLEKAVLVGTTVIFFAVINAVKLVPAGISPRLRCSSG